MSRNWDHALGPGALVPVSIENWSVCLLLRNESIQLRTDGRDGVPPAVDRRPGFQQ